MGTNLKALVAASGALVGGVLGVRLEISTSSHPRCAGPCTDGARIWLPADWCARWGVTSRDVVIAVLAHEAGHGRLCPDIDHDGPSEELRADWYAGYCLGRLGVGAGRFLALLKRLPSGPSHPLAWIRGEVVRQGWARGLADARLGR